ncbi:hypothetical protein F383_39341 [Gossypium arboreum]|uniref:Uncharacterized protein n=1 Tax=Gossypium arboreum TaxID=29729 RepID=A0A0B0MP57_GOSAR|nr:hypothetical protein F383_39341 [Gossypium arboreum]
MQDFNQNARAKPYTVIKLHDELNLKLT